MSPTRRMVVLGFYVVVLAGSIFLTISLLSGGGRGRLVFAAGTASMAGIVGYLLWEDFLKRPPAA